MFVVLDTNHLQELRENKALGQKLDARIRAQGASVFTCIIAAEESL